MVRTLCINSFSLDIAYAIFINLVPWYPVLTSLLNRLSLYNYTEICFRFAGAEKFDLDCFNLDDYS